MLGCAAGFKPRSADSPTVNPLNGLSILIHEDKDKTLTKKYTFQRVLEQGLRSHGAELVTADRPGVIILNINDVEEDTTVSAYSAVRQVREFSHYIELDFLAQRKLATGKSRQVEATLRADQVQIYDSQYVLGGNEEESAIQEALRKEVVRLLALRLATFKNTEGTP